MLKYVVLPAMTFDQPSGDPGDEYTKICYVTGTLKQDDLDANVVTYTNNNPGKYLPLDELKQAVVKFTVTEIEGISSDGEKCKQVNPPPLPDGLGQKDIEKTGDSEAFESLNEIEKQSDLKIIESVGNYVAEKLNEKEQKQKEVLMKISSTQAFYDFDATLFFAVSFDKKILPLEDWQINLLPEAFDLRVQSSIDGTAISGVFIPIKDKTKRRSLNGTEEEQEEVLIYRESKYYVSQAFEKLQFHWRLQEAEDQELKFKIDFQYPYNVSKGGNGYDIISLIVNENDVLLDSENKNALDPTSFGENNKIDANLIPMRAEPGVEQQIKSSIKAFNFAVFALQSSSIYANLFLSKGLQDVWGIINAQIITIHMTLFKCQMTTPANIYTFNSYLSQLTQKDMYPTDEIFGAIFNFKDEDSPIEHFESLGYEGAVFISLTGSIIINLLIPLSIWTLQKISQKLARRYPGCKCFRTIGVTLGHVDLVTTITQLYMGGFLELVFCEIISIIGQDNAGFKKGNASNIFSAIFMVFSISIMVIIISHIMYSAVKYRNMLEHPEIQEKYGHFYEGIKKNKFLTSIFPLIFYARRLLFVMIIIFLSEFSGLQIVLSVSMTQVLIMYLAHFKPFEDPAQYKAEIFNEVCTMLVSYFLMWLGVFPDYSQEDLHIVDRIGLFYIISVCLNIVVNVIKLSYSFVTYLPTMFQNLKNKFERFQYNYRMTRYLKKLIEKSREEPGDQLQQYKGQEASKILRKENYSNTLKKITEKHLKETQWLLESKFKDKGYEQIVRECQQKEQKELQTMHKQLHNIPQQKGLVNVELEISDIIPIQLLHNHPLMINRVNLFPYKEDIYLEKQRNAFGGAETLSDDKILELNRAIYILKQEHLFQFFEDQLYSYVPIIKDGNCGPRAISLMINGHQNKWKTVRREVCQKMEKDLNGRKLKDRTEFKDKLKRIMEMKKSGKWFTDIELQECSNLYNLTIVVFTLFNKMRFMDTLIEPSTKKQGPTVPYYLVLHDNHFTVIVHREQSNLRKFFKKQSGCALKPFKSKDFLLQDEILLESLRSANFKSHIKQKNDPKEKEDIKQKKEETSNEKKKQDSDLIERKLSQKILRSTSKALKSKSKHVFEAQNAESRQKSLLAKVERISEEDEENTSAQEEDSIQDQSAKQKYHKSKLVDENLERPEEMKYSESSSNSSSLSPEEKEPRAREAGEDSQDGAASPRERSQTSQVSFCFQEEAKQISSSNQSLQSKGVKKKNVDIAKVNDEQQKCFRTNELTGFPQPEIIKPEWLVDLERSVQMEDPQGLFQDGKFKSKHEISLQPAEGISEEDEENTSSQEQDSIQDQLAREKCHKSKLKEVNLGRSAKRKDSESSSICSSSSPEEEEPHAREAEEDSQDGAASPRERSQTSQVSFCFQEEAKQISSSNQSLQSEGAKSGNVDNKKVYREYSKGLYQDEKIKPKHQILLQPAQRFSEEDEEHFNPRNHERFQIKENDTVQIQGLDGLLRCFNGTNGKVFSVLEDGRFAIIVTLQENDEGYQIGRDNERIFTAESWNLIKTSSDWEAQEEGHNLNLMDANLERSMNMQNKPKNPASRLSSRPEKEYKGYPLTRNFKIQI